MNSAPVLQATRFVGIDLHKDYVVIGAVDAQQNIVLTPRRCRLFEVEQWRAKYLLATDAVGLEATSNAWTLYDQLVPHVCSVTVAHPLLVKLISAARVKTDSQDTIKLARLLAAGRIPAVWVPPLVVRELRGLVAHRRRMVNLRTQARNRLHAILHRHSLPPPDGGLFAQKQRAWWEKLCLSATERLRARQDLALLDYVEPQLAELERELLRLSATAPWAEQVPFLVQLPGVGVLTAMVWLAAIGEIERFPSAKHLVSYSGLGVSVHASGQTFHTGGITKQGRRELRATLVEAAWMAVEHSEHWRTTFEHLATRTGRQKAIVAVARKMLVVVWHVLSKQQLDRQADVEHVARKFLTWGTQERTATRQEMSRPAFVRQQLDRLGTAADLQTFAYNGQKVVWPPSSLQPAIAG